MPRVSDVTGVGAAAAIKGVVRAALVLALVAVGLIVMAPPAQAVVFQLTSDHCTGGCGTPPFGTVTVTQNGVNLDVTVHLNSPNFFVKTGALDGAFVFSGSGVALGDITIDAHTPALTVAQGPFTQGSVGTFDFAIECPTCSNGAGGRFNADIVFHVANATIADLTAPNASGNIFAADIISCTADACSGFTGPPGTGNTGAVDVTGTTAVPEPATMVLLGIGFVALGLAARRPWFRGGKR